MFSRQANGPDVAAAPVAASFVAHAHDALWREHTLWRASPM
ncbi:hypothetical protein [Streptomyces sp. NPDC058989]